MPRTYVHVPGSERPIPSRRSMLSAPTQAAVLAYLKLASAQGKSPTAKDLTEHFGWSSTFCAYDVMRRLETKGLVQRAITPCKQSHKAFRVRWVPVEDRG
jgi:hypothetical protein